jgi:3-hydroxy-5-methyl-1-naphthoate 3-O-methyltransferase
VLYGGSVAKLLFREFWRLEVIEFPRADFRILPLKSKFATEPEIAQGVDFTPYHCLLDVAGGPGGLSIAIGRHYPHLRGVITDVPAVCQVAEERIAAAGLTGRFTAVAADLLQGPYPSGADVITLGWILHDWNDASCRTILRHCFAAWPSADTLFVVEKALHDD